MSDCTDGYAAIVDAEGAYSEAHAYYEGEVAEVFASQAVARRLRKTGDRFKMNVIRSVVNAVSDRLDILSTTVSGSTEATIAQQRLDAIKDANGFEFEMPNVLRQASELGDSFVLVWDTVGEDGEAAGEPVLNRHSPLSMRVVYDADNPRVKKYAVQVWKVKQTGDRDGKPTGYRMNLYYADRVERWVNAQGTKPEDETGWEHYLDETGDPDSWVIPNPYGEVPVFHFRNGAPYGEAEHRHGYGSQDAINKIVIAHMSTIDFHIAPQRYALTEPNTAGPDDFENDDDEDDFTVDTEPSTPAEKSAKKGLKSGPGTMQLFENVKSVGEFSAADSKNFIDPAAFYLRMMAQTTETPLHLVDESGDEPSGESRRRKEAPLVKKVKDRQRMYAATIGEMLSFALKVAGLDGREVVVTFAPAEVVSDAEGWATIKAKMEAGVPVRQALAEAGYSTEQIQEWFPEGEENGFRLADLAVVADILQKIGAAVAMNIITAEEGRALLPEGALPEGSPTLPVLPAPPTPTVPEPEPEEA